LEELQFYYNLIRKSGTLHEALCIFMTISRSVPLRMRNVSDKIYRENKKKKHFFQSHFRSENLAVFGIMWKNMVQPPGHRWQYNSLHTLCMLDK